MNVLFALSRHIGKNKIVYCSQRATILSMKERKPVGTPSQSGLQGVDLVRIKPDKQCKMAPEIVQIYAVLPINKMDLATNCECEPSQAYN